MQAPYSIVEARPRDLRALAAIERAAARLLEGHAPESVLNETTDEEELREAQAAGRLWVALVDDAPVGFALVAMLGDGSPHLEEVDVDPRHGKRGLGTALVRSVCDWAARSGHSEITLTTFLAAVKHALYSSEPEAVHQAEDESHRPAERPRIRRAIEQRESSTPQRAAHEGTRRDPELIET